MLRKRRALSALGIAGAASLVACGGGNGGASTTSRRQGEATQSSQRSAEPAFTSATTGAGLPLELVADVPLPGAANRFDYQDIDPAKGHLVIAHMNDASVVIANVRDGSVVKVLPNIPTARGVVVAPDAGRIFVTSSPDKLVIIDSGSLEEIARVTTGAGPDGVGWDATHKIVGVSDQRDGALSLITDSGSGTRTQVKVGDETGNVVYDAPRGVFWITVVSGSSNQLVAVDPTQAKITRKLEIEGCKGAHGLRLDPEGKTALIACEENAKLARMGLGAKATTAVAATGSDPDVLAVDPSLGWVYVAAESGDLTVFDLGKPGLSKIDEEHPGDAAHTVAVDPATHHVFFPLAKGPHGTPVLRIMKPSGT